MKHHTTIAKRQISLMQSILHDGMICMLDIVSPSAQFDPWSMQKAETTTQRRIASLRISASPFHKPSGNPFLNPGHALHDFKQPRFLFEQSIRCTTTHVTQAGVATTGFTIPKNGQPHRAVQWALDPRVAIQN